MLPALLMAVALAAGCSDRASRAPERIDIRGRITGIISASPEMRRAHAVQGFIRVEGAREPDTQYDRAAITITDSTAITVMEGETPGDGKFAALKKGDSVEATFTGPVRESYPVQVTASHVRVIGR